MQLRKGELAPLFVATDIWGKPIHLDQLGNKKVLLSFFRYAECAICQLRMVEIMREKERLKQLDITVIAVFQSPAESLIKGIVEKTKFDFTIIADPNRRLYELYSVKPSWLKMIQTVNLNGIRRVYQSIKEGFKPAGKVEGLFHQIPADFIIDENKRIVVAKYGNNVVDHIPLNEILESHKL